MIVGGYDNSTADTSQFTVGEPTEVDSGDEAGDIFGSDSELQRQTELAFLNGARTVYCLALAENTTTESFATTSSGTLSNTPIFDPSVNTEHSVTAQDTSEGVSVDVNIVYESAPTAPSNSNEININPNTGEWTADASSSYDITYDYPTWDSATSVEAADAGATFVLLCTEVESVINTFLSEVNSRLKDFTFEYVVGGTTVRPSGTDAGTWASNYTDSLDDKRAAVVSSPRGWTDSTQTEEVRTVGAVGALFAAQDLGHSATGDSVAGIQSVRTPYTYSDADGFGSESDAALGVTPLVRVNGAIEVDEDLTTSTQDKFRDLYRVQIADALTDDLGIIARDFRGDYPNIPESRRQHLKIPIQETLASYENNSPPLLAAVDGSQPYTLSVSGDPNNDERAVVSVGADIVGIAKEVDITLNVGRVTSVESVE